jgi:TPR repeat protein
MHELGQGVVRNGEIAAMLYGLAAEKSSSNSLCQLARFHKDGGGVVQNLTESFERFRLAALQGAAHGQHGLACTYVLPIVKATLLLCCFNDVLRLLLPFTHCSILFDALIKRLQCFVETLPVTELDPSRTLHSNPRIKCS